MDLLRYVNISVLPVSAIARAHTHTHTHTQTNTHKQYILYFLDSVIKLRVGKIVTDLYCKSTNCHQCLHYDSCHAEHIKRSIAFSQTL